MRVSGPRGEILGACGSGETHRSAIRSHRSALAPRTGAAPNFPTGGTDSFLSMSGRTTTPAVSDPTIRPRPTVENGAGLPRLAPSRGAGRLVPTVWRRGGAGAAVGSRARCDGRPGTTRRGAAPSENADTQRRIRVSCGAAREPGKAGNDEGPSTSEPSMAPPTPTPVFSRRPLSARQRKILNERVLSRPPPGLGGANDGAPGSGLSLQASRQQAELFKGLTQQLSGLAALGLGNVSALEQWRKTSQEPEGRNENKKAPRRCSCCYTDWAQQAKLPGGVPARRRCVDGKTQAGGYGTRGYRISRVRRRRGSQPGGAKGEVVREGR